MNCCDERRLVSVVTRVEPITALATIRGAAMALGGAQFLPWWLSFFLGSWRLFINKKNQQKRQRKKSKAKGIAKWAIFCFALWGLTRPGFGSFGRFVSLPDRETPRVTSETQREAWVAQNPGPLALLFIYFIF